MLSCLQPLAGIDPLRTFIPPKSVLDLRLVSNPLRGSTLFGHAFLSLNVFFFFMSPTPRGDRPSSDDVFENAAKTFIVESPTPRGDRPSSDTRVQPDSHGS